MSSNGRPQRALLEIQNLVTQFDTQEGTVHAVNGVNLTVNEGEILALVGESGSGKSVTMLSVMGLIPQPPGKIVSGEIYFDGLNLSTFSNKQMRGIRGKDMAMVFQDPNSSLNPVMSVGRQITEALKLHTDLSSLEAQDQAIELLNLVGIPEAEKRAGDYPHQFSGGMRQRVMIAMALSCDPKLLIADEPTTALDVTIQAQIVELVKNLQRTMGMAVIWITHDLGLVANLASRVAVMYAGRIVEEGKVEDIYARTRHPYTQGLLESIPQLGADVPDSLQEIKGTPPDLMREMAGCPFAPRCFHVDEYCLDATPQLSHTDVAGQLSACWHWDGLIKPEDIALTPVDSGGNGAGAKLSPDGKPAEKEIIVQVDGLKTYFTIRKGILQRKVGDVRAVDGVDLEIRRGETLGLVGESGCGKTTFGRTVLRLYEPSQGSITFDGQDLTSLDNKEMRAIRQRMQMIFQDPYSSMNPGMRVWEIIGEPLKVHGKGNNAEIKAQASELLEKVGLNANHIDRHPHEFSGGQRQRIVIARALSLNPDFIICDEPVSSLDVSVQAQIINLLEELQRDFGLTYLFIAHDLAVVRHISDRVAVMYLGKIVELTDRDSLYSQPYHPYTQALLSAVPVPDPAMAGQRKKVILKGDLPSPVDPPSGCRFHTRCPIVANGLCNVEDPEFREVEPGRWVACHLVEAPPEEAVSTKWK
ncbi:MAG: ABC transporter ATP-binding protein [Chloroflexota bacterium]|nr:MAG: ABC transporter ATP-binding protein [Chloroflexota bacterium]